MPEEGLRERHRRRTRARIAQVAMALFAERGFERVSVAEIAAAAEVSEKTVFNYFGSKVGLFFDEGDDLLAELLHAVRTRPAGASALESVGGFLDSLGEWAAHRRPPRPSAGFRRLVAESPALQAARREMFARYEAALAAVLAAETGAAHDAVESFVAAAALIAVLRVAFEASTGTTAGNDGAAHDTAAALELLATGLGHYAIAPSPPTEPTCTTHDGSQ